MAQDYFHKIIRGLYTESDGIPDVTQAELAIRIRYIERAVSSVAKSINGAMRKHYLHGGAHVLFSGILCDGDESCVTSSFSPMMRKEVPMIGTINSEKLTEYSTLYTIKYQFLHMIIFYMVHIICFLNNSLCIKP